MHHRTLCRVLAVFVFVLPFSATVLLAAAEEVAGHWEGEIETPGTPLGVKVDLTLEADSWKGTIDIPLQGAVGIPLEAIEITAEGVRFRIQGVPGAPTFDGHLTDGEIRGTFRQGGGEFPFRLGREEAAAAAPPRRPQTPAPPFPYRVEAVGFDNGDVHLAATLTLPEGDGPFPAVVLITGSGPQDRDETLLGHKPFLVLADHLTRAGVAVLRADDRGVGGSTGDLWSSTSSDFADDALAGVAALAARGDIDPGRIGLLGHSEGGLVAPLAAARSEAVKFVVLLAGPGVPGDEIVIHQSRLLRRAQGIDAAEDARQAANQRRAFDLLQVGGDEATLRALLLEDPEVSERQADVILGPWFRFFLTYDPAAALRLLRVPVLAVNGEFDLQVDPEQNLPPIRAALEAGGNEDFTVQELPGLNHLFQHTETGNPTEYGQIEETLAPELLATVTAWILERFGPEADRGSR